MREVQPRRRRNTDWFGTARFREILTQEPLESAEGTIPASVLSRGSGVGAISGACRLGIEFDVMAVPTCRFPRQQGLAIGAGTAAMFKSSAGRCLKGLLQRIGSPA